MFRPTQTSHALTHDHSGVKSFLPLPTAPRDRRKEHPGVSRGVRLRALERSRPRHPAMTLWKKKKKKTIPRGGNWAASKTCSSSCAPEQILGRNALAFQGNDSMMQGPCAPAGTWCRELFRDTGLAWGHVQCTALLVWLTDRYPMSSEIFIYRANCAERASFPANTLLTFPCSCTNIYIRVDLGWDWFKILHKTHHVNTYLLTGGADLKRRLNTTQHTLTHHLESFTVS